MNTATKGIEVIISDFSVGSIAEVTLHEDALNSGKMEFNDPSLRERIEQYGSRTILGYVRRTNPKGVSLLMSVLARDEPTVVIPWNAIKSYIVYSYLVNKETAHYDIKGSEGTATGKLKSRE